VVKAIDSKIYLFSDSGGVSNPTVFFLFLKNVKNSTTNNLPEPHKKIVKKKQRTGEVFR
jgi:hypothetical protein